MNLPVVDVASETAPVVASRQVDQTVSPTFLFIEPSTETAHGFPVSGYTVNVVKPKLGNKNLSSTNQSKKCIVHQIYLKAWYSLFAYLS